MNALRAFILFSARRALKSGREKACLSLAEGLAYPIGWFMTGQQYGINHSQRFSTGQNAWADLAENSVFQLATTNFIPTGMFYDLLDSPSFPANTGSGFERIPGGVDSVDGISFEEQYNALNASVRDIAAFKARLIQNNSTGNTTADIENVFTAYGH